MSRTSQLVVGRFAAVTSRFSPSGFVFQPLLNQGFFFIRLLSKSNNNRSFSRDGSGSEAIEASLKIARHATGKTNVIVFRGAHHGRTIGTMGLSSSKIAFYAGFGPFAPGVVVTKYPYCVRCLAKPAADSGEVCCGGALADLEQLLRQV